MDDFYADMHRGIERNRAAAERNDLAASYQSTINRLRDEQRELRSLYDQLVASNAGNLALRYAFASELAKIDPSHPLVRDAALRDRMVRHAQATITATNGDWDAVRELGSSFQMPRRG